MAAPESSADSLSDFYQNAPCGFHSLNAEGTFLLVNDTELSWLGYRRDELIGRMKMTDVLTPESRRSFEENFLRSSSGGALRDIELTFLRKNGASFEALVRATAVRDPDGNLQMTRSVVYDLSGRRPVESRSRDVLEAAPGAVLEVTARWRTEQPDRKNEARYRLLFENSTDGILLTVPDGRIFDANPSACSILGRTREQIIAAGREGILDTSDPDLGRMLEERRITGKIHCELTARHTDGTVFPMEISSAIFRDAEGSEFTCIIFRDISLRKQAQAERERLIAELTDALGKVKLLTGLLSICSSCKRIRDEEGHWERMEVYIRDRSAADFSHGLCPDCLKKLYPDYVPR